MKILTGLLVFFTIFGMIAQVQPNFSKIGHYSDPNTYFDKISVLNDTLFRVKRFYLVSNDSSNAVLVNHFFKDHKNRKQGLSIVFNKDKTINSKGIYFNDKKQGVWYQYTPMYDMDGALIGKFRNYKVFDNGKVQEITITNPLADKKFKIKSVKEGEFEEYYASGNKKAEGKYYMNFKERNYKEWYDNGILKEDVNHRAGYLVGEGKWYFDNGQMSSWEKYDDEGNLIEIKQWEKDGTVKRRRLKPLRGPTANLTSYKIDVAQRLAANFNKKLLKQYRFEKGRIKIKFSISEKGKISNLEVTSNSGLPKDIENECIRIIETRLSSQISYYHNIPVAVKFNVPITFK